MIFPIHENILFLLHIMLAIVLFKLGLIALIAAHSKIKAYVLTHFRFSRHGYEPAIMPVKVKAKAKNGHKAKRKPKITLE